MIKIDVDVARDLKLMAATSPGPYMRITEWLSINFKELNNALNHLDPDPSDTNFNPRFHYRRGFVAALDTLAHVFADPDSSIPTEPTGAEPKLGESDAF